MLAILPATRVVYFLVVHVFKALQRMFSRTRTYSVYSVRYNSHHDNIYGLGRRSDCRAVFPRTVVLPYE